MTTTYQTEPALLAEALAAIRALRSRVAELESRGRDPIAIVGMSCNFPGGVTSVDAYWSALLAGADLTQEVPPDRWDNDAYYDPVVGAPGKICTKRGGFVGHKDLFDAAFFRISPREAAYIDPQQRLLLETAWEALENANIAADDLYGTDAGVFVGISSFDYVGLVFGDVPEALLDHSVGTGSAHSAAAGRISYALGVHGPSLSVDTACSSSLVAVQLACESLRRGECNLALVGGVNMVLSPLSNLVFSRSHMLSPDGRCKTFDDAADGYARSEGAGMLVLKRLSQAIADGDHVLAVIRGVAVNQDGRSGGLTVPNGPAQQRLIARALDDAGVAARDIGYIEAHGTGTPLGDPIEMNALGEAFQASHHRTERPLYVGSAKTNLGHMEAAAGVGGLIKLVLQLQRGRIAPHLHFQTPSSRIAWNALPVQVPTQAVVWPTYGERRIGGVSSFGFTGTNAHVIVEEAPPAATKPAAESRRQQVLCLSAKSESALSTLRARYVDWLEASPGLSLRDVCAAANVGRSHFEHRLAVVAESVGDAALQLAGSVNVADDDRRRRSDPCQVAFLYTGQGQDLHGAGRVLFRESKVFREELTRCDDVVSREVGFSVVEALCGGGRPPALNQTAYAQPLTVSLQIAITALLRSWGVAPAVVGGHSLGEYAAAHAAGVMSLDDTLKLVAWRGKLMQGLKEAGIMVALECEAERVHAVLADADGRVAVAAVNSPSQTVLSGAAADVEAAVARLPGVHVRRLDVSHAFHSPLMRPMLAEYQSVLNTVRFATPCIELVSMLSGSVVGREVASPEHWLRHVLEPVEFARGVTAMHQAGANVFLEVGAQPTLLGLGARCLPSADVAWLSTLDKRSDDWDTLLAMLARLYAEGANIDWKHVDDSGQRSHAILPNYPFERRRHWYVGGGRRRATGAMQSHPLLGSLVAEGDQNVNLTFESVITATSPRYLQGHRILDHVIFPVSGYFELALAASGSLGGPSNASISDLNVAAPLTLQEGPRVVRTTLEPLAGTTYRVRIASRAQGDDDAVWQLHAQATLSLADEASAAAPGTAAASLTEAEGRLTVEGEVAAADSRARERGFQYGSSFCCIRRIWVGEGEIRAALSLDDDDLGSATSYAVHPALLDAAIQIVGPLLPGDGVYLPIAIEGLRYIRNPGTVGQAHLSLRGQAHRDGEVVADLNLFDASGNPAIALTGLRLRPVSKAALDAARRRDLTRLLYTIGWQNSGELTKPDAPDGAARSSRSLRLLIADSGGTASALEGALREQGAKTCVVELQSCEHPQRRRADRFVVDPQRPEDFEWLLSELEAQGVLKGADAVGVTYLSGLDLDQPAQDQPLWVAETQLLGCGPLLNLVKAGLASRASFSLQVVTRGALAVRGRGEVNVAQSAIGGMVTTLRSEAPLLHCRHIDLDPTLSNRTSGGEVARLAGELLGGDHEDLIAFRASQRLVGRLERYPDAPAVDGPVDVYLREYGSADELVLKPATRRDPVAGEVEIAVRAAGLNFKDVLHVWGVLRSFCEEQGLPWIDRRRIGFECSGVVVRAGAAVSDLKVGDEVIGLGFECLNSFVTLDARSVVRKPAVLSHEEAAGIPTAYLTAVYGLLQLAKLKVGESVLVHAAAGGVGQAALRVCADVGANVYATASSSKWDFLRAQGIHEPMSSRTLDFENLLRQRTEGRGVDVVLNSLGGEFIPASLNALAPGGRFIEIGKRGIWSREQVAEVRPDVQYFAFDLGDIETQVAEGLPGLLREVCRNIEAGRLAPLPVQPFAVEQVGNALRTLAESKNVGKVVVQFPDHLATSSLQVRNDRTYLVTGGLGGLGLETAAWLLQKGARHVALVGRNAPAEKLEAKLQQLRDGGASVLFFAVDVSGARAGVEELLAEVGRAMPPIGGIVHAAGVTEDVLLSDMSWGQLERVLLPKVVGGWNLHSLSRRLQLDFFVAYSSATASIGSLGQANYTAANAFLDALCTARFARGLPGLSVGWGPWADVGMAERMPEQLQQSIKDRGLAFVAPARNFQLLELLLKDRVAQAIATQVDWSKYLSRIAHTGPNTLFTHLKTEHAQDASRVDAEILALKARLEQCPAQERRAVLMDYLRGVLARVLRFAPGETIDARRGLFDLGLDSLAVVEVKSRIEQGVGRSISATVMLDFPTLEGLTNHLHDELFGSTHESQANEERTEVMPS